MSRPLVLAITGASGSAYAVRLLQSLLVAERTVHLTISPAACQVFESELGLKVDLKEFDPAPLLAPLPPPYVSDRPALPEITATDKLHYYHFHNFSAGIASGSFLTDGMAVCPCSMGTLGALAHGLSSNLIHRAADVHLKERRKLVLVPRETPLGSIQLENMKRLSDAGAIVMPAMPGYYHEPTGMLDLVDFVVARVLDQLGVEHRLLKRWGG